MKQNKQFMLLALAFLLTLPCMANEQVQAAAKAAFENVTGGKLGKLYKVRSQAETPDRREMIVEACVAGLYAIGDSKNAVKIQNELNEKDFLFSFTDECGDCNGDGKSKRACYKCKGAGKCQNRKCNDGIVTSPGFDGRTNERKCSACGGIGKCANCKGEGAVLSVCRNCNGSKRVVNHERALAVCQGVLKSLTETSGKDLVSDDNSKSDASEKKFGINDSKVAASFLMCGGGPKAGEVSAKFRAYDFAVGDTSDLGNSSFRKKKGIKASDVSECFDKHRKGSVFRYHTIDDDDKTSTKDIKVSRIAVATEQYKRIVKTEDGWTFSTGVSGAAEVAELIYGYIEMVTTRACKGEIVASSPNVKYLGLSEAELKKELTSVYIKTALNGGGSFGIQWKRSDGNYVAWQCCIATKGDMVIDMLAFTVSDILVREDTFGNEECESKVGAEVEFERGRCFSKGDGVNKDMYEAVKWYRKAAERGYAPAQFSLGCCYHSGHGVDKNSAEAVKWIRKAAEQGIVVAQSYLAICYEQGDGVSMDKQESLKWYRKAADGGHAHSQYILGLCYWSGDGLIQNSIEAEKWLIKAAEQGHAEAQYTLGKFYGLSDGGPRNTTEAIKWLRKASNQGHKGAKVLLDILVK